MIVPIVGDIVKPQEGLIVGRRGAATVERATIGVTLLTSGTSTTDGTSFSTASVSPTGDAAVYAFVCGHVIGGQTQTPTALGNGLTWVLVDEVLCGGGSDDRIRIACFRAMGASPSSGVITFDYTGQTQTSCSWTVVECSDVDTSGTNASGATVQSTTGVLASGGGGSIDSVLSALENENNVHLCAAVSNIISAANITVDAQFASLSEVDASAPAHTSGVQWAAGETTCSTGTDQDFGFGVLSVEVKAGAA